MQSIIMKCITKTAIKGRPYRIELIRNVKKQRKFQLAYN